MSGSLTALEERARLTIGAQLGLNRPPPAPRVEKKRVTSITEAIPYMNGTKKCTVCNVVWSQGHSLMFFLDGEHHDRVLEVLQFLLGLANKVEAMAMRYASQANPEMFHEKAIIEAAVKLYGERGPQAVRWFYGLVGYYAAHEREREATKRGVKEEISDVLIHFNAVANFLQIKERELGRLWGEGKGEEKLRELYHAYASTELSRVRTWVLHAETLMAGEHEKVVELSHRDPIDAMLQIAKIAPPPPPPAPSQPASQAKGV